MPPSDAAPGEGEAAAAEPEETCGFCKFMKAGPCRDVFVVRLRAPLACASRTCASLTRQQAWEKCVDTHREAGDDFVDACMPSTRGLKECMEANPEYYGPLLVRLTLYC